MTSLSLRSLRTSGIALSLAALAAQVSPSSATAGRKDKEQAEEEVDLLSLAARLVADGHYDRAGLVLKEIKPEQEGVDLPKLHFLRGTVALNLERHEEAVKAFKASIQAGQSNPSIYVYLAQSQFQLKDYKGVIQSLGSAGPAGRDNPGVYSMRAEAHYRLKQPEKAVAALDAGIARFPDFAKLTQMKLGYLMDLGLYQEVVRVGQAYLNRPDIKPEEYAAIAEGLRKSGQLGEARMIMEQARLRYPDSEAAAVQLANIYNDLRRPLTAAMLFESATYFDPKYHFEAAELYKEADRLSRALTLNARIFDPKPKLKQRLSILLSMERFELIAGMEPSLSRAGLLKDENIRYALAYGYFKNGDFETAEKHLKQLTDSTLFEKATALRKAMATCREAGWACY